MTRANVQPMGAMPQQERLVQESHTQSFSSVDVTIPRFMLEITTGVGCVVACKFCPQKTFLQAYTSQKRKLDLQDFKKAIDKTPADTVIIFSGFSEPYLNTECTRMVLYAHETGHPVSIFTTGTGMALDDVAAIKHVPFSSFPHGGFVLHLADNEGYARINVDAAYLELVEAIQGAGIQNLLPLTMGTLHQELTQLFSAQNVLQLPMNSRAGYLTGEGVQVNACGGTHGGQVTCGRDEHVYNNVMLPNGDVVLCCQDFGMKHVLGNLLEEPYESIVPAPLASFELCKSCHNAIGLPQNFPLFHFEQK